MNKVKKFPYEGALLLLDSKKLETISEDAIKYTFEGMGPLAEKVGLEFVEQEGHFGIVTDFKTNGEYEELVNAFVNKKLITKLEEKKLDQKLNLIFFDPRKTEEMHEEEFKEAAFQFNTIKEEIRKMLKNEEFDEDEKFLGMNGKLQGYLFNHKLYNTARVKTGLSSNPKDGDSKDWQIYVFYEVITRLLSTSLTVQMLKRNTKRQFMRIEFDFENQVISSYHCQADFEYSQIDNFEPWKGNLTEELFETLTYSDIKFKTKEYLEKKLELQKEIEDIINGEGLKTYDDLRDFEGRLIKEKANKRIVAVVTYLLEKDSLKFEEVEISLGKKKKSEKKTLLKCYVN